LGQYPAGLGYWLSRRAVVESLCPSSHACLAGRDPSSAPGGAVLEKGDPDPKALACYGVLWQTGSPDKPVRDEMWLRFVSGRPVSDLSTQFLDWCCDRLAAQGKRAWLLIWDNASWHISKIVQSWIREHNHQVKRTGKGVRLLPLRLPTQSPWLNPIEPKWVHGKRAIVEPNGLLSAKQLAQRIRSHFGCSSEAHLSLSEKVA
jgi:transposase